MKKKTAFHTPLRKTVPKIEGIKTIITSETHSCEGKYIYTHSVVP